MTTVGQWIDVRDGKCPAWLRPNDVISMVETLSQIHHNEQYPQAMAWCKCFRFALPADHWAYAAIDKGYEPWAGGPDAPSDWDGGDVLGRHGRAYGGPQSWTHPWNGGALQDDYDIIGYKRRNEPTADTWKPDQRTVDECVSLLEAFSGAAWRAPAKYLRDHFTPPDPDIAEAQAIRNMDPPISTKPTIDYILTGIKRGRELERGQ